MADHGVVGVAGHVKHFQTRVEWIHRLGQLPAAHPRHHDIRDQQIELRIAFLNQFESVLAVAGFEDGVAVGLQRK